MRLKSLLPLMLVATVFVVISARSDDAQASLADVAKQKSSVKAKHVITDDDMPSTRDEASADSRGSSSSNSSSSKTDPKDVDQKAGSAASTNSATTADLDNQLKDVAHDEDLLKRRLQELNDKADKATDPFRRQLYKDSIANQQVTVEELAKKRKELEQQIADKKAKKKS